MKQIHILCISILLVHQALFAQKETLRQKIKAITQQINGTVGVAITSLEDADTLTFNGKAHLPMQSVFKFPLAMAVLHEVDKGKLKLDQPVFVSEKDLLPGTWSPLREKYPKGNVNIPLREIIRITVSESDNNGCDRLFKLLGGTKNVENYIRSLGIKNIAIVGTEEEMHNNSEVQFANWAAPVGMLQLLKVFYEGKTLSKSSTDFLQKTMLETVTGPNKIKGLLPKNTPVAHKTGYSGVNAKGICDASNDVGIVTLPNGKHFAIVVFVCNTTANEVTRDGVMAQISKATWDYFNG